MFKAIDKHIERLLKEHLHKRRGAILDKTLDEYIKSHHPDMQTLEELKAMLEVQVEQAFAYGDSVTIGARIITSRWVFWSTLSISIIVTVALTPNPATALVPIIVAPLTSSLLTYFLSIATIPTSYDYLVYGAMNSAIVAFDQRIKERENSLITIPELIDKQEIDNALDNKRRKIKSRRKIIKTNSTTNDSDESISVANKSYLSTISQSDYTLWKSAEDITDAVDPEPLFSKPLRFDL